MVFHVLNRGVGRRTLFETDADYLSFERVLVETLRTRSMRVCAYVLMPNHWHFILWPERDGDLAAFMQQLTNTHVKRWKEYRGEVGEGHLYQGRYKCFAVENSHHFYDVARYVERNALRAGLVDVAQAWPWSSLWRLQRGGDAMKIISEWPVPRPSNWIDIVNRPQTEAELEVIRRSVNRSRPFGTDDWALGTADRLGLEFTMRSRGRPRRESLGQTAE
jgi:REP-associated tyrosine transposase